MKYTVTGLQMKQIDQDTIERIKIPSVVLMERAALASAEEVINMESVRTVLVVCGTGNNGADGIAVGRILEGRGYEVTVVLAGNLEHATKEHQLQQEIAQNLDVCLMKAEDFLRSHAVHYDVIVDALFGIGLARPIEGAYRELMQLLQEYQESRIVAVDIPS